MTKKKRTRIENHFSKDCLEIKCGVNQLRQQFMSGDILWVRSHECSWWPGQVVKKRNVRTSDRHNKKAKDEVLVRLYGTYEYLSVDPVQCSSEFENFLKKENNSIREAFQKALEEDLSRMKLDHQYKRKVSESEENVPAEASKCKKPNQDRVDRNREADSPGSPGASLGKPLEVGAEQTIEKSKARYEASREKRTKQDVIRKSKITEKVEDKASKDKSMKQGVGGKPKVTEKASNGTSKVKIMKKDDIQPKPEVGEPKVTKAAKNGASKVKITKKDGTSKVKITKKDGVRQPKPEVEQPKVTRKARIETSTVKITKKDGTSNVKTTKKDGIQQSKQEDVKKLHKADSPSSNKRNAPEETPDVSGRRIRVMQSLGLIAPLGSPFRRNGLVKAATPTI